MKTDSFYIDAGALCRGQVKREILGGGLMYDVRVDVQEVKSLFESRYIFTVRGRQENVDRFMREVRSFCRRNGATIA
jgi:hypothetical protein